MYQFTRTVWMLGTCDQCLPVCTVCVKNVYDCVKGLPLTVSATRHIIIWLQDWGVYASHTAAEG